MEQENNQKGLIARFCAVWVKPKEIVREVVDTNPMRGFWVLSFIYGLNIAFGLSQMFSLRAQMPLWGIVVGSIALAMPIGAIFISILSAVFFWIGKLIKGEGSYSEVRAATAWSQIVSIVHDVFWIIALVVFGGAVFDTLFPLYLTDGYPIYSQISNILQGVASVWGLVILVKALGEVQGFSAWMGLLNVVLSIIAIGVVYSLVFLLIRAAGAA